MKKLGIFLSLLVCLPLQMVGVNSSVLCCVLASEAIRSSFRWENLRDENYISEHKNINNLESGSYIHNDCSIISSDFFCDIHYKNMPHRMRMYRTASYAATCTTCVALAVPCCLCAPVASTVVGCCVDVCYGVSLHKDAFSKGIYEINGKTACVKKD